VRQDNRLIRSADAVVVANIKSQPENGAFQQNTERFDLKILISAARKGTVTFFFCCNSVIIPIDDQVS